MTALACWGPLKKRAKKLHRQLCHASFERLKTLLTQSGCDDKEFFKIVQEICTDCFFCNKYKKPCSKPVPRHRYSRDQLFDIKCSKLAQARPDTLGRAFDTQCKLEDPHRIVGLWDPEKWYKYKVGTCESSPLTWTEDENRRRILDIDRESKRRQSINNCVERVKENERDSIVLRPQRRSFIQGCHVTHPSISRQHSISETDQERRDSMSERERERGDREMERPIGKVGSGRTKIDRENFRTERDFSALRGDRDRHDDRERRDMGDRNLAFVRKGGALYGGHPYHLRREADRQEVRGTDQLADCLTKSLTSSDKLRRTLMTGILLICQ